METLQPRQMENHLETAPTTTTEPLAQANTYNVAPEQRLERIQQLAHNSYMKHKDWINFFREVLGTDGIVRKMFPTPEELAAFEKTEEYAAIQQMVTQLRKQSGDSSENEPTRVITVRLPKSVHEALKSEAHLHQTSMNQLCISKLLQLIDKDFVPNS
jgi:predicted HicB family RNase H-like nuclease